MRIFLSFKDNFKTATTTQPTKVMPNESKMTTISEEKTESNPIKQAPATIQEQKQAQEKVTNTQTKIPEQQQTTIMDVSTKISHTESLLEETTISSTNPIALNDIKMDSPFIVFPEENEISNEIPTSEEFSKSEKESTRSTTVSYSIVRPVATYHIVPVKKTLRA